MEKTTVEPRYFGESKVVPKKYVSPEYRDPKPIDPKNGKTNPFCSRHTISRRSPKN